MAQVCDNHLDSKCTVCKNSMEITDGVVLYDTKWYHQKCWESSGNNGQSNRS